LVDILHLVPIGPKIANPTDPDPVLITA